MSNNEKKTPVTFETKKIKPSRSVKRPNKLGLIRGTAQDSFTNLALKIGKGSGSNQDGNMYAPRMLSKQRIQLENMYRGNWICGMSIDTKAGDMVRAGVTIKGEDTPQDVSKLLRALVSLGIWRKLKEAIQWGMLYGGAIAYIDIEGQDPETPLTFDSIARGKFKGLRVFDRWMINPSLNKVISEGSDMALPEYYQIVSDTSNGVQGFTAHHSRCIRFIGVQLPYWQAVQELMWGAPVFERLEDRLDAFNVATGSAANLVTVAYLRTIKIDGLRQILVDPEGEQILARQFANMRYLQSAAGVTVMDKADEFETSSYSFSGLSDVIYQFAEQISGAIEIPLVRLLGQSPAGLNSSGESDLRNYYDHIRAKQEADLRVGLTILLQVIHASVLGTPAPEDFDFDFTPLWQTSAKEKADIAKVIQETVSGALTDGSISPPAAAKELRQAADATGIFTNITEKDIAELEAAPPPAPDAAAPLAAKPEAPPVIGQKIPAA